MIEKRSESTLLAAAALAAVFLTLDLFLLGFTELAALRALVPFTALAIVVCLLAWFRCRLARVAEQEKQDEVIAREEEVSSSLFDGDSDLAPFTAGRTRAQFERFAVPVFAPLLAIAEGVWAWRIYTSFQEVSTAEPQRLLLVAALLGGQAFLLFLFSRFLLGLARNAEHRLLRGPGVLLGVTCLASAIVAVAAILSERVFAPAPVWAGWILVGFLGLLSVEHVFNFIGDIYRPRKGRTLSTAYESRLGGLLTDPASWVNNMAQALDYQFGFNVSHTWFYRFLRGALLPLVLFQLTVLYLLSCLVFIGPEEEGILEQFGRPLESGAELDSGAHFKWPWPFETVRRFPAKRILNINIGHTPEGGSYGDMPILWSQHPQATEDLFLVASSSEGESASGEESVPVSLLNVHFPVEYRITNVHHYAYNFADPGQVLEEIAYRCFSLQAAGSDIFNIMGTGQEQTVARLRKDIQGAADEIELGVEIVFIGLQGVHPPAPVVPAFESVIGARQEKEAIILGAHTYAAGVKPLAKAASEALQYEAEAYQLSRAALVSAETDRFRQQIKGYEAAPNVYTTRWYLRTLRDAISGTRKYILAADGANEILQFNFEEAVNPDLFDLGSSESNELAP